MRSVIILLGFACTVFASLEENRLLWGNFKSKHGKIYHDVQEDERRFSIFQQNIQIINEHNRQFQAGNATYTKGVNQFTDLTKEEFVALLTRRSSRRSKLNTVYKNPVPVGIPDSIDWRQSGAVSQVKNQGGCGSCWAFSATGALESHYFMKYNQMVLFSEQQLVDCDWNQSGCNGGDEGVALNYIKENGIETENDYPYEGNDNACRYDQNRRANVQIQEVVLLQPYNEYAMQQAVGSIGPTTVALDASQLGFYSGGVFTSSECSQELLNHALLAVGYGHDDATGLDYWLVKNSWSQDWGDNGYFKIKRGVNECGVAVEASYPVLV